MKTDNLKLLLTPSWLSGLIAITAALVVSVGVILLFSFNNSDIHQQLIRFQTPPQTLTMPGERPAGNDNNSLQTTWPLLTFWGIVGLASYVVVESLIKVIGEAAEFKNELNYVHARRDLLLKWAAEYLLLRLTAIAGWLLFINLFLKRIIPYCITVSHAAFGAPNLVSAFAYGVLAFVIMAVSIHLQTVFLRLAVGRVRLFSL